MESSIAISTNLPTPVFSRSRATAQIVRAREQSAREVCDRKRGLRAREQARSNGEFSPNGKRYGMSYISKKLALPRAESTEMISLTLAIVIGDELALPATRIALSDCS